MARTTRSSAAAHDKDKPPSSPPQIPKQLKNHSTKKRKRNSGAADDDQPVSKLPRTDSDKGLEGHDPPDPSAADALSTLPYAGDIPLNPDDSSKILDILEMIDTQGLLDRVFPLQADSSEPSSTQSYSFRNLLKDSSQHPLSVLRSAVRHLFPISSHPRSKRSLPAAQQLQFCNLALSLLEQASCHSVSIPPEIDTLFPSDGFESVDADAPKDPPLISDSVSRKIKYALTQHLPSGDWWTSLNSDSALPSNGSRKLSDIKAGHAQLVAILPSPTTPPSTDIPKLGSYHAKAITHSLQSPACRRISAGSFLDYGAYASFAPAFDQESSAVGRTQMGEVLWAREERRRQRGRRGRIHANEPEDLTVDVFPPLTDTKPPQYSSGLSSEHEMQVDDSLDGLLPPDDINSIKSIMMAEALEQAIQELLERNKMALRRLEEMQYNRLMDAQSEVIEGSEEWDTAQGIMDSLTTLAALRPRTSDESNSSIIPSPSIIRKLSRTLPMNKLPGWYGTLPAANPTALCDDSTIKAKAYPSTSTSSIVPVASTSTPPIATTSAAAANPVTTPYPYAYPGYSQYRNPGYAPYKTGTTQPYGATSYSQSSYYQPYPWYTGYSDPSSERGTPQAGISAQSMTSAYAAAIAKVAQQQQQQQQQQRGVAVANTVTSTTGAVDATAPTLPPYLRHMSPLATSTTAANGLPSNYYSSYAPAQQQPITSHTTE